MEEILVKEKLRNLTKICEINNFSDKTTQKTSDLNIFEGF